MELINIAATDETPQVILNPETHVFEFNGKSLPEDVTEFFNPLMDWLTTYQENPGIKTIAIFKMDYFNTASSKLILDILMLLEEIHEDTEGVTIEWHFKEDDEDMEEAGEEYADIVEVPFKQMSY
jgi:hypothetical protein